MAMLLNKSPNVATFVFVKTRRYGLLEHWQSTELADSNESRKEDRPVKKAITLAAALDVPRIENTKRVTATLEAVQILKGKQKERCAIRPPEGEKKK
jgi:hypothetical protein